MTTIFAIIILSAIFPIYAISFYWFMLRKKRIRYDNLLRKLTSGAEGASGIQPRVEDEFYFLDYILPLFFSTGLCALGFYYLFGITKEGINYIDPFIILAGPYFGKTVPEQFQNLSLISLVYAFLGAYVWGIQNIFRRFVTADLPPTTFYYIGIRIILGASFSLMLFYLIDWLRQLSGVLVSATEDSWQFLPIVAFLTPFFPTKVLKILKEIRVPWLEAKLFSESNEKKADRLPLQMIEGIKAYQEERLLEEGIDNAQSLATANTFKLMARTPFKPWEIIDWVGQAKLYIYFKEDAEKLRKSGIRTAFDLIILGGKDGAWDSLASDSGVSPTHIENVYAIFKNDPNVALLMKSSRIISESFDN